MCYLEWKMTCKEYYVRLFTSLSILCLLGLPFFSLLGYSSLYKYRPLYLLLLSDSIQCNQLYASALSLLSLSLSPSSALYNIFNNIFNMVS
jgi:hypothetical protein